MGCLSTVVLAYFLCFHHMVNCAYAPALKQGEVDQVWKNSQPTTYGIKYRYWLYNRCSEHHIQVVGRSVTALGTGENATVIFESLPNLTFRIRGVRSQTFICFNKKGKLIAKYNGNSRSCRFWERLTQDMYTELESVYNSSWYIGFNRNGKPIRGYVRSEKAHLRKCFQFIKIQSTPETPKRPTYGPPVPKENIFPLLTPNRHRKARNRPTR